MATDFASFLKETGIESPADFKKHQDELLQREKEVSDKQRKALQTNISATEEFRKRVGSIGTPTPPKLEELPKAPEQQFRDPLQALGGFGALLAMIGSLKTRAPLTSALDAAAASMNGFHAGDTEVVKRNSEIFNEKMKAALANNRNEVDKYDLALKKHNGDLEQARSEWTAIAAENDNRLMLAALDANDLKTAHDLHSEMDKRGIDLAKAYDQMQLRQRLMQFNRDKEQALEKYRADLTRLRGAQIQKTKANAEKATKAIGHITSQIDDTIKQIEKNPDVAGVMGYINRTYEGPYAQVASALGMPAPTQTPATDFKTAMVMLQVEVASALHFSRASKFSIDRMEEAMKGLSAYDSPQAAVNSLKQVSAFLKEIQSENQDFVQHGSDNIPSALDGVQGRFPGDTVEGPDGITYSWDGKQWQTQ